MTRVQKQVMEFLKIPGAYIRESGVRRFEIGNVWKRLIGGVKTHPQVDARTVKALYTAGMIQRDQREFGNRQQVGYFPTDDKRGL